MLKAACFRAGVEGIEVDPAYTSVIGAVNHARRHGIGSHQGAAYAVARRGLGLSERARPCGGRRAGPQWTAHAHLRPTREESDEACMVVLGGRSEETQSGACSACPVGRQPTASRAAAPESATIGRYLGFAGETPAREASAGLFGRRPGRSSLVGEWLPMFLGTAQMWISNWKPILCGLACLSHKRSPAACELGLSASLGLGFLALLAVCRPTAPGENRPPPCIQAHPPLLGYELCETGRLAFPQEPQGSDPAVKSPRR